MTKNSLGTLGLDGDSFPSRVQPLQKRNVFPDVPGVIRISNYYPSCPGRMRDHLKFRPSSTAALDPTTLRYDICRQLLYYLVVLCMQGGERMDGYFSVISNSCEVTSGSL